MSLETYIENGFKLFLCRPDKSPDIPAGKSWHDEQYHLNLDKALTLQNTGHMIGAWIPKDLIVLDLDRHKGKSDGVENFNKIKELLNLNIDFISDTHVVQTAGNGFHLSFNVGKNHGIKQGEMIINKEKTGIDIKTNSGYVIASGSPGYATLCDFEPMIMPERLQDYILDIRGQKEPKKKKENTTGSNNKKLLSVKLLKSILSKTNVESFRSNDRWQEFITAAVATAGDSEEVGQVLEDWSNSDPEYSDHRNIRNRISSFSTEGGITPGTFIMFLREENLSPHMINQVVKLDSITSVIMDGEEKESELPFNEPDYHKLSQCLFMKEFFTTCGNSAAKKILFEAVDSNVIYVKGEKELYYFNGSRWDILKDMYSVVYTVLFRVTKIFYAICDEGKENQDRMMKVVNSINDTTWKAKTITELNAMIREDFVDWDSPAIKESITTIDGVIDFSNNDICSRPGYRSEFRLKHIEYKSEDIINASEPTFYKDFMKNTFPNKETLKMAHQLVSLCISGNTEKRIFQLWEGEGSNGKSTLIEIIKYVLKGKTNTYPPKMLMPDKFDRGLGVTPELVTFRGSYASFGIEVEQVSEFSMGIIKNLTGGDTITANPKHKAQVEFEPTWQLILAVNDLPKFNSLDGAFVGRLCILPFVMSFPRDLEEKNDFIKKGIKLENIGKKRDKNSMLSEIYSQKSGIIKFMIETYVLLQTADKGYISQSPESLSKKKYYVQDNDDFGKFINDNCVIDPTGFVTSEEITEAFKDYMGMKKASPKWVISHIKKHNRQVETASKEVFVYENGGDVRKRRRGLTGIRLKSQIEIAYEEKPEGKEDPNW